MGVQEPKGFDQSVRSCPVQWAFEASRRRIQRRTSLASSREFSRFLALSGLVLHHRQRGISTILRDVAGAVSTRRLAGLPPSPVATGGASAVIERPSMSRRITSWMLPSRAIRPSRSSSARSRLARRGDSVRIAAFLGFQNHGLRGEKVQSIVAQKGDFNL